VDRFAPYATAGCFPGRICVEHKELYRYYAEHGEGTAEVSGRLRHQACGRGDFPAVGDWVALKTSNKKGSDPLNSNGSDPFLLEVLSQPVAGELAVIQAVLERDNKFSRTAPGKEANEQIIAANLDTLFLVTSLNRDLNPRRIERYLSATTAIPLVLLLSKSDLVDNPDEVMTQLRAQVAGVAMHALSARTGEGMEALAP
jgi:ribosome biogenesis GTPase